MQALYETKNAGLEDALLESLAPDEPWSLIERFTTLVRESSSEDERAAFDYVAERLDALGVDYTMHMPEQFLSVPIKASLEAGGATYRAKTPGFSVSTPAGGISGEAIVIEGFAAGRSVDFFDFSPTTEVDVEGKIVVVDGFGGPPPVWYFQNKGAKGASFINPGVDIHWGICTTIWGAPDLDNYHRQPTIPVVSINRPDGEALLAQLRPRPEALKVLVLIHDGEPEDGRTVRQLNARAADARIEVLGLGVALEAKNRAAMRELFAGRFIDCPSPAALAPLLAGVVNTFRRT